MLAGILDVIRESYGYSTLLARVRGAVGARRDEMPPPIISLGVLRAARPALVAALQEDWPGPTLWVSGSPESARQHADQMRIWSKTPDRVFYFQAPDAVFYDPAPWDPATIRSRAAVLAMLSQPEDGAEGVVGKGALITASMWALMTKSVSPTAYRRAVTTLAVGQRLGLYRLLERCVRLGYEPATVVEEPGTFSHRGSIVDFYPPHLQDPVRIDFFGDEIETIRTFNPSDQRSKEQLSSVVLAPASEALPEWGPAASRALARLDLKGCNNETRQRTSEQVERLSRGESFVGMEIYLPYLYPRAGTLFDFLPESTLILVDDILDLKSAALSLHDQARDVKADLAAEGRLPCNAVTPYYDWEMMEKILARAGAVGLGAEMEEGPYGRDGFIAATRYNGQLTHVLADVAELRDDDQRVVIITRQAERLTDLLRDEGIRVDPVRGLGAQPDPGSVSVVDGIIAEGWAFVPGRLLVLSDAEIFGWARVSRRRRDQKRRLSPESFYADLREGDYVVHMDYGIGRYLGMVRKTMERTEREYLAIEYANGDRLYVPVQMADRVGRYRAGDDRQPRIHRLGGTEWHMARAKAEKAARDLASELLELYATRQLTPGHAFAPDTEWQRELEDSFPYEETPDQERALEDVKADMEQAKPMDRLLCGDVGYGKTEVALRGAFKAVMDGKQVAVLVPTTVLAQQHYHTFRRRLRAYPVRVEMLSRFRTPQEQREVLDGLRRGRVDIVIGTHRLLSADVEFKDLGLLVIDEEQRFGVMHKERLKQIRREIDVLTLTATPIPRTLSLALSGARDMSIIDTAPEERLPVRTFVSEYDESLVRRAILREIDRGGQVFYVHNRVQDIRMVQERLNRVVPEASVVVGHGQMDEQELAQVMLGFARGEHDVLLSTTIIESGLDMPNVNTLIIDRADALGLAQLYQLRGRVGRGRNRAYAYLFYRAPLTDIAAQRLQTIQEANELGAGYFVAMRDLEIRGAGEVLGAEQHGHIAAVGFDLYCRLLQHAVTELQAESGETVAAMRRAQHAVAAGEIVRKGVSIDIPLSAYLPESFVPDTQLRLRLYRRMARVGSRGEIDALEEELVDRFGELAEPVQGLFDVLRVRVLAEEAGLSAVSQEGDRITLVLPAPLTVDAVREITQRFPTVTARADRIWVGIADTWRDQLLEVLEHVGTLRPVSV